MSEKARARRSSDITFMNSGHLQDHGCQVGLTYGVRRFLHLERKVDGTWPMECESGDQCLDEEAEWSERGGRSDTLAQVLNDFCNFRLTEKGGCMDAME